MLPSFLHIGAAKCASTWLWRAYQEHPEMCVPADVDNPSFFLEDYHRGFDWYNETYFSHWAGERVLGETSNSYMVSEPALERIARDLPDVRLTMTLRNPVERAYVAWVHLHYRRGFGPEQRLAFEDALKPHGWAWFRYWMEPSMYAMHLKNVFRHFPKDRVLVMLYDDLVENPSDFLRTFLNFLDVDCDFKPSSLDRMVGFPGDRGADHKGLIEKGVPDAVREQLQALFREDIEAVQEITERDLSHWN